MSLTLGGATGRTLGELTLFMFTVKVLWVYFTFLERSVGCFLVKPCTASDFVKESASYGGKKAKLCLSVIQSVLCAAV